MLGSLVLAVAQRLNFALDVGDGASVCVDAQRVGRVERVRASQLAQHVRATDAVLLGGHERVLAANLRTVRVVARRRRGENAQIKVEEQLGVVVVVQRRVEFVRFRCLVQRCGV